MKTNNDLEKPLATYIKMIFTKKLSLISYAYHESISGIVDG